MTRILDRLVARTFLKLFVVVLAAAPPLFILGDVTESLDNYLDRGLTGAEVARSYLYQIPQFIQWSFPIAALVATVFTVHTMTRHHEIVAAKAGGISFHRIVAPIVVLGALLTGVALGLSDLVPRANRIASQIQHDESPQRSWRSDFVYQSEDGLTWQVARLTVADGRMTDVILERPPTSERAGLHVLADAAAWSPAEGWTLYEGYLRRLRPDSTERAMEFQQLRIPDITERPEELLETPPEPDEMTFAEIDRMARIVERTGGDAAELLVRREQKIAVPVATLIIILFAAPLATTSKRGGTAFGVGLSLGTFIVYVLMLKVFGALGEAGAYSPRTAAWVPNAVFLVAAAAALVRVRT
jgi:lipopolysaccharide export system permease protein